MTTEGDCDSIHTERYLKDAGVAVLTDKDLREGAVEAILEYGGQASICLPFIGDAFRTRRTFDLDKIFSWKPSEVEKWEREHDAELVAAAEAFQKDLPTLQKLAQAPFLGASRSLRRFCRKTFRRVDVP